MTTLIKTLTLILLAITFIPQIGITQSEKIFQDIEPNSINTEDLFISPQSFRSINFNLDIFEQKTNNIPKEVNTRAIDSPVVLTFPLPNGSEEEFRVVEYSMMESELAANFPNIKTYIGVGVKNPLQTVRFDYTDLGLRAVMRLGKEMVYIDPVDKSNSGNYISYYRKDYMSGDSHTCHVVDEPAGEFDIDLGQAQLKSSSCGFLRYTIAVAATAEYSAFYNATSSADASLVLSGIATSINRVNSVFENDLGIRLVLVNNMENLFYYNAATDPYTNNNPVAMLGENQTNITAVIGEANYDLGHVVSTSAGGVASVNSPCRSGFKARGVTGLSIPQGDPFDIDFLSHEIGHQFGAMHTFNNFCSGNVNWDTAVEPGSGSTIMGYAGTCYPNVQMNSDAYFHAVSLAQINAFINGGIGSSCSTIIPSVNNQPEAEAGSNYTIPASTPFYLQASGSDIDGDTLTFCWEQMDNDSSAQSPINTSTVGPTFRSYLPSSDSVRYFPNLADLASGSSSSWEVLPAVSRDLEFRLTVRDNSKFSAGCYAFDDVTISVEGTAGPFVVTAPSNTGITWTEGDRQTITWDVANTDLAPINCSKVDILLSYDGGLTFPVTLVKNVDNDGNTRVTIPEGTSTNARIMVRSVGNVFFDISDNDFTIVGGGSDFTLSVLNPDNNVCSGDDAIYEIVVGSLSGFSESIILSVSNAPAGVIVDLDSNPIPAGNTTQLIISGTENPAAAFYTLTLNGASMVGGSSSTPKNIDFNMILGVKPSISELVSPMDAIVDESTRPTFTWDPAANASGYEIQVSDDINFSNIVQTGISLTTSFSITENLESAETHYWRVRSMANCGNGDWSAVWSFTTHFCGIYTQDGNLAINDPGDTYSILGVPEVGSIISLEVLNVEGTHTWVADVTAGVISPNGTEVTLWSGLCGSRNDFSLSLSDNSENSLADITCEPLGGGNDYQPQEELSNFNDETSNGNWLFKINDNWGGETGILQTWSLKICMTDNAEAEVAADPIEIALPLDLHSFDAHPQTESILLDWEVENEKDLAGYEIERRKRGTSEFNAIDFVEVLYNQNVRNKYAFEDTDVEKGIIYQYRLRMLDQSGAISYSKIEEAKIEKEGLSMDVYPNPARDRISVDLWGNGNENVVVEIIDIAGKRLAEHNLSLGNNTIDTSNFSNGIYIIRTLGEQNFIQQKLVIN